MPRETAEATTREDDLAFLLPRRREVKFEGGSVTVRELTIEEGERVLEDLRVLIAGYTGVDGAKSVDLLEIVKAYRESALRIAEATTGIAVAKWRRVGASALVQVVRAAIEENLDFFVQCAELGAMLGAGTPANGSGPMLSDTSSGAAT